MFGLSKIFEIFAKLDIGIRLVHFAVRKWFKRQIDKRVEPLDRRIDKIKSCLRKFYRKFKKFKKEEFVPLQKQSNVNLGNIYLLQKEMRVLKKQFDGMNKEFKVLKEGTSYSRKDNSSVINSISKSQPRMNLSVSPSKEDVLAKFPKDRANYLAERLDKMSDKSIRKLLLRIIDGGDFDLDKLSQFIQSDDETSTLTDKVKSHLNQDTNQ